jgi:methanogenic corrinoid protein MtbC1
VGGFSQDVLPWGCFEGSEDVAYDPGPTARQREVEDCAGAQRRLATLVHALETEVIPRLARARRAAGAPLADPSAEPRTPGEPEVVALTELVLSQDVANAATYVDALRARGVPLEAVFLDLLAPCARRLGELWKADRCDFTQVTVGLWRLHQLLRDLSATAHFGAADQAPDRRRILLAPAPGEQHMFGICMVAEFFRRSGWDVVGGPQGSGGDLAAIVRGEPVAVIGLSLSGEARLDGLANGIREIRRASRNRAIRVLVGGNLFNERPDLVALVGADATASDGREAPEQAKSLLRRLAES